MMNWGTFLCNRTHRGLFCDNSRNPVRQTPLSSSYFSFPPPHKPVYCTPFEVIMFLIEASIGMSAIHGVGVFAKQPIKKGTVVWVAHKGFDIYVTQEQIDALPPVTKQSVVVCWSLLLLLSLSTMIIDYLASSGPCVLQQ